MPHEPLPPSGSLTVTPTAVWEPGADHHASVDVIPAVRAPSQPLRLGIGGPVGSGKTALVAELCRSLRQRLDLAVVTNDIYTTEDADFLRRAGVLEDQRIVAVETGCCPHTAIRDDITANLAAIDELTTQFPGLELLVVESGGDNLTATFSAGLVDRQIFVVDVAGGDKVPRKGGPGITRSDLLVINKSDLAALVGADLAVMLADARHVRGERPVAVISLRTGDGVDRVLQWLTTWIEAERPAKRRSLPSPG